MFALPSSRVSWPWFAVLGASLLACGSSASVDSAEPTPSQVNDPEPDPEPEPAGKVDASSGTKSPDGGASSDAVAPPADGGSITLAPGVMPIGAGEWHSCVLRAGGLKCWGGNYWGSLGLGNLVSHGGGPSEMGAALPYVDLGARKAVSLETGEAVTCVILDDGTLSCWGKNDYFGALGSASSGDLGDSPTEMGAGLKRVLLDLAPGEKVTGVSVGSGNATHTCALLSTGRVKCWGANGSGALGLGDTKNRGTAAQMGAALPAVDLGTGRKAIQISSGAKHNCAILENGHVKCWGDNFFGQLGLGDANTRGDAPGEMGDALPEVNLGAGRTAKLIAAGWGTTCAVLDDDSIKCWGVIGEYGNGVWHNVGYTAADMGDALAGISFPGRKIMQLALRVEHACVVLDDGTARCWGRNGAGQLGYGDKTFRNLSSALPTVDVGPGRKVVAISPNGAQVPHTCALLDDATVKCWGSNGDGQLGLGDKVARGDAPGEMGAALPAIDLGP